MTHSSPVCLKLSGSLLPSVWNGPLYLVNSNLSFQPGHFPNSSSSHNSVSFVDHSSFAIYIFLLVYLIVDFNLRMKYLLFISLPRVQECLEPTACLMFDKWMNKRTRWLKMFSLEPYLDFFFRGKEGYRAINLPHNLPTGSRMVFPSSCSLLIHLANGAPGHDPGGENNFHDTWESPWTLFPVPKISARAVVSSRSFSNS